jgi:TRAP-type C4-dicarboxylate transport system substrate-binding protein
MKDAGVTETSQLKGMKIRAVGGVIADFYTALGASPVTISSNEQYEASRRTSLPPVRTTMTKSRP